MLKTTNKIRWIIFTICCCILQYRNTINNSKNTGIKTKLKALQTVSPIKGIIRGILFKQKHYYICGCNRHNSINGQTNHLNIEILDYVFDLNSKCFL